MRKLGILLLLTVAASAQERAVFTAGEALDAETCVKSAEEVKARIEKWCRLKYRRPVPVSVQPRKVWERAIQREGYAGHSAKNGAAFYYPVQNHIVVVPWVIGGYQGTKNPPKLSRQGWIDRLESTIIHELMHALHCQNFYVVLGGAGVASLRTSGLSAQEKDLATVDFLVAEGVAELVAARTATREARMLSRLPEREISAGQIYWDRYQPDGKKPFRVILFDNGYQDGIDLLNQLVRKAGPRALRAVLYRPPPRELLFQPELLAKVQLDDPPDPDSAFAFLSPDGVKFGEVLLAVSPGKGRYFRRAATGTTGRRAKGCLLGYTAVIGGIGEPNGKSSYSLFIADPDKSGNWSAQQVESLKQIAPKATRETRRDLPASKGIQANVLTIRPKDQSLWIRAEVDGLVVLAHETKPTRTLEKRVLLTLRVLHIRRPRPSVYAEALVEARQRISTKNGD
ncbi:MAG: hypothetical protein ACYS0E_01755 [Planctomycetota bacterium]|jgi:hypothetical protein